ncbi:MAG: IPT/TIG domain-containing protein [Bacteroidota bacterium]|nr:IPT/TIG domain-containing protein [Bacteroidota bacterium]
MLTNYQAGRTFLCRPLIFVLVLSSYSCSKSDSSTPPPPPPPPASPPTITAVSPLTPYAGDVITINGTGFNTDISKDTVDLGIIINNVFSTALAVNVRHTRILSATSTRITLATDSQLVVLPAEKVALVLRSPTGSATTAGNVLDFKQNLIFSFSSVDPFSSGCGGTFAGDSIYLTGRGFYQPISVTIDGHPANMTVDQNSTTTARGFLPITYFGVNNPIGCAAIRTLTVRVINGDGKSFVRSNFFWPGPNSQIQSASFDNLAYSLSNGTNALFTIKGYALRSDWYFKLNGHDNGSGANNSVEFNPGISNYPTQYSMAFDLGTLPVPSSSLGTDYNMQFKVGSGSDYGFAGSVFTLYK